MSIVCEFDDEQQVQRLLFLVHQDLARVVGNIVLSEEKLDDAKAAGIRLPGRIRTKAVEVLKTAPDQEKRLRATQEALQAGLKAARERGEAG